METKISKNETCTICDIPIIEHYCTRCGQRHSSKKITTFSLIADVISNFFSMEKSGFVTILRILHNPKPIAENYFAGFKNYHASPGKILLYGIAVLTLHLMIMENEVLGLAIKAENLGMQYTFWLFFCPLLMVISHLTFIRQKLDFSRHVISITYIATSMFIAVILLDDIIMTVIGKTFNLWALMFFIVLVFYWNSRVFSKNSRIVNHLLNTFIQIIIFATIGCIIVLLNMMLGGVNINFEYLAS